MDDDLLPLTQLIYSCLQLAEGGERLVPTSPGVLDNALFEICERKMLPDWARARLHFVDGSSGLRCLELPEIQALATEAKRKKDPNPSYTRSELLGTSLLAERTLYKLKVSEADARVWGAALKEAATAAQRKLGFGAQSSRFIEASPECPPAAQISGRH